jgi:ABC-type Mn2+/Zn2+ transport system permease subunit
VFEVFDFPFMQRALVEVLVLSLAAGTLGTWIVVRGLSFYAHGVAAAAFPGLVLADGLGFSATLGAFGVALLFALTVGQLAARSRSGHDSLTALVLVAALAIGVVLASDVFHSGSNVETLLFGSLLAIGPAEIRLAVLVTVLVLVATWAVGQRWLAVGFDPSAARGLGVRSSLPDLLLLALVALAAVATLSAVGALLSTALLVVPAATTRMVTKRMRSWQLATIALTAVEGVFGLWLAFRTNAPPGATIAVISGGVFGIVALGATALPWLTRARTRARTPARGVAA